MDFTLNYALSPFVILILIAISVLLSWITYRNKLPGPGVYFRYVLPALRTAGIFLILFLFASPVISSIKRFTGNPRNIVLIDNSESLAIENRFNESLNILQRVNNSPTGNNINEYYFFSDNLKQQIDKIPSDSSEFFNGDIFSTDIGGSITNILELSDPSSIASVLVISDGINTKDGIPSYLLSSFGVPVGFIIPADSVNQKDLSILSVSFNKTAFIDSRTPVKVNILSNGFSGTVKASLFESGHKIFENTLTTSLDKHNYEITFHVSSGTPGFKSYTIELEKLSEEVTYINNSESFFIKYIDNKFRVLVVSGSPSPDFAFLKREIKRISNFETTFLTQKSRGTYYEDIPDLNLFSTVIFIGYPNKYTDEIFLNDIYESIERNQQSVFFFASTDIDLNKIPLLDGILPFIAIGSTMTEFETSLRNVYSGNLFKDSQFLREIDQLPQIFSTTVSYSPKPGSNTILINNKDQMPAFIVNTSSSPPTAAFLSHGFFKWRLSPGDSKIGESTLSALLSNTILAITDKENQKKIRVETEFTEYSPNQIINISAFINPDVIQYSPKVNYKVYGADTTISGGMIMTGHGVYTNSISLNKKDDYFITAELSDESGLNESDTTMIKIGRSINEFRFTNPDSITLHNIATATGGYEISTDEELEEFLSRDIESLKVSLSNVQLNFNPWLLGFVILIFSLEWFLRKRNNLP